MALAPPSAAAGDFSPEQDRIMKKVLWRVVPFLFICYVVAYLDRVNVGIAGVTMTRDLGLTASQFGWSAGLFFFGYFLAEIPSNLALQRFGARVWIARILITWGLLSAGTAFVTGPVSFGVMRFLLGLGEAGFTPGVFLYFTFWFPGRYRGRAVAAYLLGIPVANILGSPLSSSLLALDGAMGLSGWQWLLFLEGIPATILGFVCLFVLSDGPEKAKWLTADERSWLSGVLAAERRGIEQHHSATLLSALTDWRVIVFSLVNFCAIIGSVGIGLWMPQMLRGMGFGVVQVGFVAAIPYICGAVTMMYWASLSDRSKERGWFPISALILGAVGLVVCAYAGGSVILAVATLAVTVTGIMCYQSTFWPLPQGLLTGSAAAGGLALIVSIGNLGGFVGPFLIGAIRESTGSFALALLAVSGFLLLGAGLLGFVNAALRRQHRATVAPVLGR